MKIQTDQAQAIIQHLTAAHAAAVAAKAPDFDFLLLDSVIDEAKRQASLARPPRSVTRRMEAQKR